MKVEIDLDSIFADEGETLQESIRRQVVDNISTTIEEGIGKKIDAAVAKAINDEIAAAIKIQMPAIMNDLLSKEYDMVDRYGDKKGKTTFKEQLLKSIVEQAVYQPKHWDSDKNMFTKAVDAVVTEQLTKFKSEFNRIIDGQFVQKAFEYAQAELIKKLGVRAN